MRKQFNLHRLTINKVIIFIFNFFSFRINILNNRLYMYFSCTVPKQTENEFRILKNIHFFVLLKTVFDLFETSIGCIHTVAVVVYHFSKNIYSSPPFTTKVIPYFFILFIFSFKHSSIVSFIFILHLVTSWKLHNNDYTTYTQTHTQVIYGLFFCCKILCLKNTVFSMIK